MKNLDYEYFQKVRDDLLKEHLNDFVIIKNQVMIGFTKTQEEAFEKMSAEELGSFIVQKVIPAKDDTVEFYSMRVSFA